MLRLVCLGIGALLCQAGYAQSTTPVILISVDTLRADHLGCYQAGRQTPHIDSLTKGGTLFSQVSSPFPLTLPSHVALFTSTYPFSNGVQDNGVPLKTSAITLATILKGAGYHTAAFVSSFVLDRRFGLNRGFDVYDGPIDLHNKTTSAPAERKRLGSETATAATHWLEHNGGAPFFLFLHLYDLHLPYDLPQGYDDEVAYEDKVVGDFLAFLDHRGLLQKSLIVFTSDHGEALGEHGESTHGYFIYQSTLHVPLVVHWSAGGRRVQKDRVDDPASLLDVAPTILEAIGAARPQAMRGRSWIGGTGAREIYSETLYARNHFGCAPLRSIRTGNLKYIEAPKPELYDLAGDPHEQHNLYDQQRTKAAAMAQQIAAVRAGSPAAGKPASPSPETVKALRSLGYLSGPSSGRDSHVDPKDRIADFERYSTALNLSSAGKLAQANTQLEALASKLPDITDIRVTLGLNEQRMGDYSKAALEFKRAIEQSPSDAQAHFELGFSYFQLHQLKEATQALKAALALEPWYTRADEALAEIYLQQKDLPQARSHLTHLLTVDPNSYTAHYNLGIFAALQKNWSEAQQHLLAALRADPGSSEAHDTLGKIYMQQGESDKARQEFEEAVRLQPKLGAH